MAVTARLRAERGMEVETMWSDDGFVIRLPDSEEALETEALLPSAAELKDLVLRQLGSTSLFAAKFREAAGRALLLPQTAARPARAAVAATQARGRSAGGGVAVRFLSDPAGNVSRVCARSARSERRGGRPEEDRARRHSRDHDRIRQAFALRFGAAVLLHRQLHLRRRRAAGRTAGAGAGHRSIAARRDPGQHGFSRAARQIGAGRSGGAAPIARPRLPGETRRRRSRSAVEAGRFDGGRDSGAMRDAGGGVDHRRTCAGAARGARADRGRDPLHPSGICGALSRRAWASRCRPGLAETFLAPVENALGGIVRRYARTHGPFTLAELSDRYGIAPGRPRWNCAFCTPTGKLLEGEFRPGGVHREWCDPEVLQQIRRKTLSHLRREVVPAEQSTFARLLYRWQGVTAPRKGIDALLDAIEILQGAELIASDLEREILPARVSRTINRRTSMRCWLRATSCGSAASLWEPAMGECRFYLVEALGALIPPGSFENLPEGLSEQSSEDSGVPDAAGRLVSDDDSSGGRRRLSERDHGRALGTGLGRASSPTTRIIPCASRIAAPEKVQRSVHASCRRDRRDSCGGSGRAAEAKASGKAAGRCVQQRIPRQTDGHGVERGRGAADARPQRHRDAGNGRRGKRPRRLCVGVSRAEDHGRERTGAAGNVRRGNGRRSVRDAGRRRHAAESAPAGRSRRGGPSGRVRPGESIRRAVAVERRIARTTRWREPPAPASSW